ncbi:MAG: guanylate kinase [Flavobacteriaceae bacterium]|jgi:guanylate kinase|nr:guanylate kinase [Flavobacteriales bacterium]MDG1271581.1 guanylate kinase [Flavobacteriaceae bacterium]
MSSKNGKLIVFSAPSGSGKTTLVRYLLAQDIPFGFSISATSRLPRGAEQDGVDYYFLTEAAFREKIAQNAFLEYEEVYSGTFYGTLRTEVKRLWASAKHVLFDIDVVGGLNIKQQFPEECLALFVQPPSLEELEKRLRGRGTDSEETIQQRLAKAKEELAYAPQFDRVIVNDNLETAQQEVRKAIEQFLQS